jgi:hypothetical protein
LSLGKRNREAESRALTIKHWACELYRPTQFDNSPLDNRKP